MMITDIEDLRKLAQRRLPAGVYAYVSNGGYEQETLWRNRADLESYALLPRVLNDVSKRSLSTELAASPASFPVALAPVGALGRTYVNGEIAAARAAKAHGVPYCLSTLSMDTLEDVAQAIQGPFWFQLYMMKDKGVTEALVRRAKDAGCSALLLSMDLHGRSQRHAEQKHGLIAPPRIDAYNIWDALIHPRWLFTMAGSRHQTFGNLVGLVPDAKDVAKITEWLEQQFDPTLSAKDIEWARQVWPGKILVKGILHPDDARASLSAGADGVIVSNHGGRQVDGAVSTISVLKPIVDKVAGGGQVLVDSGIRSGIDLLKMLASGADGCLLGRAYVYGLAAMGQEGVEKALEIIRKELDQTMALCGVKDVRQLPDDLLVRPASLDGGMDASSWRTTERWRGPQPGQLAHPASHK